MDPAAAPMISGMDATALGSIATAVVLVTQLVKWAGLPDGKGPLAVLTFSALGVLLWGWSHGTITRATAFDYFAGGAVVATSAAGVFGFTRAGAAAVASAKAPPSGGAGSSATEKP